MAFETEILELELTGSAYGGEAVGRDQAGRVVFVPYALPGERVKALPVDTHRRWVRASLQEIVRAAEDRVVPRCQHYGLCGGCHYQHMAYASQLKVKQQIVQEQLGRLGGVEGAEVRPTLPSPAPWAYRNRVRFHLTPEGRLGYVTADRDSTFPVEACHLPDPALEDLRKRLDFDPNSDIESVELRLDDSGHEMIILRAGGPPESFMETESSGSVVWLAPQGAWVLTGGEPLVYHVLDQVFLASADSFFQVNSAALPLLVTTVMDALRPASDQLVLDLYAGVGLFSRFAAAAGAKVIAVEDSASAAGDFEVNLDPFPDVTLYEAPVDQALPAIEAVSASVVADPPRAGLGDTVVADLVALRPARMVYVSCDPATFARDAGRLTEGGYRLVYAQPVDLFPQTYHIEIVSLWLPA